MWQVNCAKNTLTAMLPFQQRLRALKRRIAGKAHQIHEQSVYSGGFDQINFLSEAGLDLQGSTILEIGTGWYPVIPLMLRLAGARQVILTDAHPLLDRETLKAAVDFLRARRTDLAERLGTSVEKIEETLTFPHDAPLDEALDALGLAYRVQASLKEMDVRVDAIISHTVLEHVPPAVIVALLEQSRDILRPGGVISHGIDHSDHRAHRDARLSRVDFLRYSETIWKLLCLNPQDYTNRLRHSDYVAMVDAAGFDLVLERPILDSGARNALNEMVLAPRFRSRDPDDLAVLWTNILARPRTPEKAAV
ncbi:class I SAM-dependent methyltransferase [Ruegeria sp. 2205SS24-7]|uniref:class I SAM-dependent methyltransferase n=1 Tax=Ruegeria discodermiae TaxID=3064389 RepID=UPI002741699E|nr:class I SAM-dependent methyltransferase [Ruegeria sp. 2205SS24-7]MDP5215906.1 class I SAM-dependent methyltransferase [Ruegeria sp. 2205SS24-7]